jgi:preprotein translocase subunit SecG
MPFIIGILTFLLIVNCVALVLLILVQLPKKDAGAGLAFGGGAADALFGAGSGNALTKITKWAAGIFIGLAIILGLCQNKMHAGNQSEFENGVEQQQQVQATPQMAPTATPQPASPLAAPVSSTPSPMLPLPSSTNATGGK